MTTRDSYLPGVPILVRIEVLTEAGVVDRDLWDAEAVLTTSRDDVTLSAGRVFLMNGVGSALVQIEGNGDLVLTATLDDLQESRSLVDLSPTAVDTVSGELSGDRVEWNGVVHVTGDTVVGKGTTLELAAGTLVLIDGVLTSESQPGECESFEAGDGCGVFIRVRGSVESSGTAERPVTFTAAVPELGWGEIYHDSSAPSLYRYTTVTRGGNSPRGGHTGTGPALRSTASQVRFEGCSFTDHAGKVMQASDSELELSDCLLARSIMGPEIDGTSLLFENCYVQEMYGEDDNDGIYLHRQQPGQELTLRDSVFASGDDDGIDMLRSEVLIENCLARDFKDKGISVFGRQATIERCLLADNDVGVSAKGSDGQGAAVQLCRSTITGGGIAIEARDKFGEPDLVIQYHVVNSILRGEDPVRTDYPEEEIEITYSNVGETWPGAGNLFVDPMFVDPEEHDFRLQPESPCIDAGSPETPPDPDATRADMGYLWFDQTNPPGLGGFSRGRVNQDDVLDLSDPMALVFHLFRGHPLACQDAADANDDGMLDVADVVFLLKLLFLGGTLPPEPTFECHSDPTHDLLTCETSQCP